MMSLLKKTEFTFCPEEDYLFQAHLPKYESLTYCGIDDAKRVSFRGLRQDDFELLAFSSVILAEESERWKSMLEMIRQSTNAAALGLRGLFSFELFFVSLDQGIDAFHPNRFSSLMMNHAKNLKPGESCLIRYCGCLGVLTKKVNEDWGKVDLKHAVQVYTKSREKLDLFVKKAAELPDVTALTVIDMGKDSLFRFGDEVQTERMHKILTQIKKEKENLKIYYLNQSNVIEFF